MDRPGSDHADRLTELRRLFDTYVERYGKHDQPEELARLRVSADRRRYRMAELERQIAALEREARTAKRSFVDSTVGSRPS